MTDIGTIELVTRYATGQYTGELDENNKPYGEGVIEYPSGDGGCGTWGSDNEMHGYGTCLELPEF